MANRELSKGTKKSDSVQKNTVEKKKHTLTCKVCGFEFEPDTEMHYTSRNNDMNGAMAAFTSHSEVSIFDTFDCPKCGCQFVAQERKRVFTEFVPEHAECHCCCCDDTCFECEPNEEEDAE